MTEKEFISSRVSRLASDGIKIFPSDFIVIKDYKELRLPGKTLLIGEEFFGKYEILASRPHWTSSARTFSWRS